jgi:hypothetical protein
MNAPEKIYGWMDSQLSIARFYGGIKFQGHYYAIDMADPDKPLVRQDLLIKDKKEAKKAQKEINKKERSEADKALLKQLGLL